MYIFTNMKEYILAIDQGTTSSRAILYDRQGNTCSIAQKEFKQIYPKPGWVEHNPREIWTSQMSVIAEAIAHMGIHDDVINSIGITNQRETTVIWNKNTGKPIYNAIVWQDKRTTEFCNSLKKQGLSDLIKKKTGLEIDSYFSATKIKWILDNIKNAREEAEKGNLLFGTIDSWLIWNLTNGEKHLTDITNASRTMLFNINTLKWDKELLKIFDIPENILPKVLSNSDDYGKTSSKLFSKRLPISGVAGDQQASLFGQMCIKKGMTKNTYGTGCFIMKNIGNKPILSKNKLLTTIAWKLNNEITYAFEGSVFVGGAVVQWLRDELNIIKTSKAVENLVAKTENNANVYFIPAFTGIGAPYWNQEATGTITGLTRGTGKAHIARAAVESIAYQTYDVIKAMEKDTKIPIKHLRVDGGASDNDFLMQFQADILNTEIDKPVNSESTSMGAAYFAGLYTGFWKNIDEIKDIWKTDKEFSPNMKPKEANKLIDGWHKAVDMIVK